MRVKFDPNAKSGLINCENVINEIPFVLNKNTFIEIGMGKGEMISKLSTLPTYDAYIGIEKNPTIAYKAIKLFEQLKIKNIKVIVEDAKNILSIIEGKVKSIYITFPDPWPKNGHEKRRLTHGEFLNIYKALLTKNGVLEFKTDNDKLFEYSLKSLKKNNWNIIYQTRDLHNSIMNDKNVQTGYEKKWSSKGKNINYIKAKYYEK